MTVPQNAKKIVKTQFYDPPKNIQSQRNLGLAYLGSTNSNSIASNKYLLENYHNRIKNHLKCKSPNFA